MANLKDYRPSYIAEEVSYELCFMHDKNSGYGFPCDENGNLNREQMTLKAIENYEFALAHQEEYPYMHNKVEKVVKTYRKPPSGVCSCGIRIHMFGKGYMGAYQCPTCGKWYNAFGQELLPPEMWEEDY